MYGPRYQNWNQQYSLTLNHNRFDQVHHFSGPQKEWMQIYMPEEGYPHHSATKDQSDAAGEAPAVVDSELSRELRAQNS